MYTKNLDIALAKLRLFREKEDSKFDILSFGTYKNMFRAYIRSGDGVSNSKTVFIASIVIPPINLRIFIKFLDKVAKSTEECSYSLNLYAPKWEDDKMLRDKKELVGKIGLSKVSVNGELLNYLDITTKDKDEFSFPFMLTPYLDILINNKKVTNKSVLSNIWLKAYSTMLSDIVALVPEAYTKKEVKRSNADIDAALK